MVSCIHKLFAIQLLSHLVACVPTISFPFNAQLPPVARIGSLYTYSFSPYTFRSETNLTYALNNHPNWLSLESEEHRLYGIPEGADLPPGEVVGQPFQIVATDETGSVTMDSTIVISRGDAPSIKMPISEQIKRFGDYSAPSSILSYPAEDFSYPFDPETFQHEPNMINYYASSGDSSPLPAWINFNAATMTFSGRTPATEALYQPPQRFDVRLVASDIEGFSSTLVEFSIIVSGHKLTAKNPMIELNASRGSLLQYDGLADGIKLDDKLVKAGDLEVTTAALPAWLSFNSNTWILEGTPKAGDHSTNFTINFSDSFSDTLVVWVKINVSTGLFQSTFHDVEVIPGEDFSLDLAPHFKDTKDVEVEISTMPNQDWLSLDGQQIKGKVPKLANGETNISIRARSRSSGNEETETLQMTYLAADGTTMIIPSATSSTETPKKSDDDTSKKDASEGKYGGIRTNAILLATIIPILVIALLMIATVCLIRRRRNLRHHATERNKHTKISHPLVGSLRINGATHYAELLGSADGAESALKTEKVAYRHVPSDRSSISSDTLGSLTTGNTVHEYRTYDARNEKNRAFANGGTEEGRESWFTVERMATTSRSEMSTRSRGSEITVPMSTHQLLPTPPFFSQPGENSFRSGLELTIPSFDEPPFLQLEPAIPERPKFYSTITTSSAALPSSRHNSPRINTATFATVASIASASASVSVISGTRKSSNNSGSSSGRDWSTVRDSELEEQVPELPPLSLTRQSRRTDWSYNGHDSWTGITSIATDKSFGSSENWRVVGHRNQPSISTIYRDLVKDSPFNPFNQSIDPPHSSMPAARRDESDSGVSPKRTEARYSRLEGTGSGNVSLWRREDSGKASDGSFTVFI